MLLQSYLVDFNFFLPVLSYISNGYNILIRVIVILIPKCVTSSNNIHSMFQTLK